MEINLNETYNTVRKYALVESIGTGLKDIWDASLLQANLLYIPYVNGNQPQGEDIYISSSSDSDTYDITIIGLGPYGKWQEETKALAGQTKTKLEKQFFRIVRVFNASNTVSLGNIYVYRNTTTAIVPGIPDDKTKIQAHIINAGGALNNEQTQMSHFTIPYNMRGWIKGYSLSIAENTEAASVLFRPFVRSAGGVFRLKDTKSVNTSGTGSFERNYIENPRSREHDFPLQPGDDIVWRAISDVAGNGVSCEYVIKLARL